MTSQRYDATTFQGDLSWQCHLNHLNAPFAQACDALFLDYHWRADFLQRTGENLGRLAKRHPTLSSRASQIRDDLSPQDIMFGIDVFGRGQYGGGQYSSYKALEQICKQPQLFGVALFGFGWISEGEELGSSRSAQEVFDSERFFYTGVAGDPPASVHTWRRTCIQARREALDQSLAEKLQNGEIDDLPEPPPPGYDFDVPLPNLIKPLSAFLPAMPPPPPPPPPLSSDHDTPEFFTNFSQGSGPAFFVQGKQISGAWTNVALSFPQPDLLFANTHLNPYIRFKLDTADAWEGNVSLQLVTTQSCVVPLFTVSFRDEKMYTCHMVFKTEAGDIPNLVSANGASSEPREWHEMVADRVDAVGTGWSEASFLLHNSEKIKQIGVALKSGDVLRIGSMGVSSEWHFKLPRLISGPH